MKRATKNKYISKHGLKLGTSNPKALFHARTVTDNRGYRMVTEVEERFISAYEWAKKNLLADVEIRGWGAFDALCDREIEVHEGFFLWARESDLAEFFIETDRLISEAEAAL